ncbi:MAG: hypothetical protein KTR35_02770 [Gammaproteobacteria bacterium]|nr:hypothetical protein [Gammaproteobacteria bacterium]
MTRQNTQRRSVIRVFSLAVLSLVTLFTGWFAIAGDNGPVIPKAKGEQCVAETDFMRRNHMRLLVHQRDETVIKGIREEPFSLVECIDCHVQTNNEGEPIRVDAQGQFCQSCHDFAAVKIDCFGCHAAIPDDSDTAALELDKEQSHYAHLSAQAFNHLIDHFANAKVPSTDD